MFVNVCRLFDDFAIASRNEHDNMNNINNNNQR